MVKIKIMPYSRFIERSIPMKKSVIGLVALSILFLIVIYFFTTTYQTARSQYSEGHNKSVELAKGRGNLSFVEKVETFNGTLQYHIVTGTNEINEKIIAWIPQQNRGKVLIEKQGNGVTKEQALKTVQQQYSPVKIKSVQLGMDENIPIWEIKYIDESGRFTYDFVNFYDGKINKHMAIQN